MFSCVNSIDSIVEGELNGNTTLDRVLEEAGKLKRKCKSLRTLLLETETKRSEEKEEYDLQIIALRQELDTKVSNLQAQSYIEQSQMRYYRNTEIEELEGALTEARNEVSMQGALIIALTRKLTYLENEIETLEAFKHSVVKPGLVEHTTGSPDVRLALTKAEESYEQILREKDKQEEELKLLREEIVHLKKQREDDNTQSISYRSHASPTNRINNINDPTVELKTARAQITELRSTVQELVRTKTAVEQAVRCVLSDNERLAIEVDELTKELARVKGSVLDRKTTLH